MINQDFLVNLLAMLYGNFTSSVGLICITGVRR